MVDFVSPVPDLGDQYPVWAKITAKATKYHLFRTPVGRSVCGNYLLPFAYVPRVQPDEDETKRCKTCKRGVRK